jgi:hypothetical protein
MINDIVKEIQEGAKKPGESIKAFMRHVGGDTVKIASMV